jgi:uncharacterized protein YccT (UPF0319 family)
MKKISALLLTLAMIPSTFALNLEGDTGVEILIIDGNEIETRLLEQKDEIDLSAGKHQIVVRYSTKFHDESPLSSDPTVLTLDLQEDTVISAVKFRSHRIAKREIEKNMTWKIISDSNEYVINNADTLKGKGFMPYGNLDKLLADYNQKNNITMVAPQQAATTIATPSVVNSVPATSVVTKNTLTDVENMQDNALISLYQQASMKQKKAFRLWLLEQDMK